MAKEKTKSFFHKIISLKFTLIIISLLYIVYKLNNDFTNSTVEQFKQYIGVKLLITVFALSILNLFLETLKWKMIINRFQNLSFINSFKSVLTGLSLGLYTPYRLGDFAGRLSFISSCNFGKGLSACIWNSLVIFLTTLTFGYLGVGIFLIYHPYFFSVHIPNYIIVIFLISSVGLTLHILFYLHKWTRLLKNIKFIN